MRFSRISLAIACIVGIGLVTKSFVTGNHQATPSGVSLILVSGTLLLLQLCVMPMYRWFGHWLDGEDAKKIQT